MFLVFVESVFVVVVAVAAVVEVGVAIVMVNPKPSTAAVAENRGCNRETVRNHRAHSFNAAKM